MFKSESKNEIQLFNNSGSSKSTESKHCNYSKIMNGSMNVHKGRLYYRILFIILNSGCSSTIVNR